MTKHVLRTMTMVQDQLVGGPWPPTQRVLVDAWSALSVWLQAGAHVFRLRPGQRTPPLAPGLELATAPLRRDGQCYVLDRGDWIVVARISALRSIETGRTERVLAFRQPLLTYCTLLEETFAAGYFNLEDHPTPARLVLRPGVTLGELGSRRMEAEEIGMEGVRLAQVLPWFFAG